MTHVCRDVPAPAEYVVVRNGGVVAGLAVRQGATLLKR